MELSAKEASVPSTPTHRQKDVSPFKTTRYSPYKISSPGHPMTFRLRDPPLSPSKSQGSTAPTHVSLRPLPGQAHQSPSKAPGISESLQLEPLTFTHSGQQFIYTRHVDPGFSLSENGKQRFGNHEEMSAIMDLFPTCERVRVAPPFLIIVCAQLPPKPWPITVAGLPAYFTNDEDDEPIDTGMMSAGPKVHCALNLQKWRTPDFNEFKGVFEFLEQYDMAVTRLQWIGWSFVALSPTSPPENWHKTYPSRVNDIAITYRFNEPDLHEQALRRQLPSGGTKDDSTYENLRPGIQICSLPRPGEPVELLTISGVCVASPDTGRKYVTVANHGFPGGVGDIVYHPNRYGKILGEVAKVLAETDIALVQLKPGIAYSRETFSEADSPVEPFRKLTAAKRPDYDSPGSLVFMDTPFNGRREGMLVMAELMRIPADEDVPEIEYGVMDVGYFGNGVDQILDGCCGAPIWDQNYNVIGQFRFVKENKPHLCYFPSYDYLEKLGFVLSEI